MSLSPADSGDIQYIVEMMQRFHSGNAPAWPFDADAAGDLIGRMIDDPRSFVAVNDGFIVGVIQPNPISPDWLVAKEFLWWSEGGAGLGLLRSFREWAHSQGASEIQMSCPVGSRAEKAFSRHGAAQEIIYSELCHVS